MSNTEKAICPMCARGNKATEVGGEMLHITDGGKFRSLCIAGTCPKHHTPLLEDGSCLRCYQEKVNG